MIDYKTLYEISNLLNSEIENHSLLRLAIDKVIETTQAQRGLILISSSDNELHFECARHRDKVDIKSPHSEISRTIIQKVLESGESLVLESALQNPKFDMSASIKELNLLSIACAPLKFDNETFGVIYIDNRDLTALFTEDTKKLLDELSKLISVPIKNSLDRRSLIEQQVKLKNELQAEKGYGNIIGNSFPMQELLELVDQVAGTETIVLITGETGTGKELIARQVHLKSPRKNKDLVVLNCSAIPENLLESELFGHEKGAFTGADKTKQGWFEVADGGSIFLDEIGELSLAAQAKLLRLIQFGELTPVGSKISKKVDVRIIAATNRDLANMVKKGTFRQDLFYRINVMELKIPALRERGDDIFNIAEHFLHRFANRSNKRIIGFSEEARHWILNYDYPGNVRELENIVQRAVLLCKEDKIQPENLPIALETDLSSTTIASSEKNFQKAKQVILESFEKEFIVARLKENNGNITQAALNSGMYKKNFLDKMKQYNLKWETYKM